MVGRGIGLSKHLTLLAHAGHVRQERVLRISRNRPWFFLTPERPTPAPPTYRALRRIVGTHDA